MIETIGVAELALGVIATGVRGDEVDLAAFGGYVMFARNGTDAATLARCTQAIRARYAGQTPPLIAIDQEGGRVARLRSGVEPMPSMMALGAAGDVELAGRAGEQVAFDLRRAGCTMNFAPVLDLALDARSTVIGTRSIGSDPRVVATLGEAFAQGLQRGGVVPCYKHFPGHGSTEVDSHVDRPVVDADEATLRARDLVPFAAVARTAPAMMGAHVVVTAFDARLPATLSPAIAGALLRGELGFAGAYVTDCLEMGAVADVEGSVHAAVAAMRAGADLLLFSDSIELAMGAADAIERAVSAGDLPLARLREAYARVLRLRMAAQPPLSLDEFPPHPGVGREIARRAVTLLHGVPHADPVTSFVVSFAGGEGPSLREEAPALEELIVSLDPNDDEATAAIAALEHSKRRPIVLTRRAHLHAPQVRAVTRILTQFPDAVIVSMLEPYDTGLFDGARHVLAAYGDDAASIGGLADVLFGGIMPQGRLPVTVAHA